MITAPAGSDTVTISRYKAREEDKVVTCSTRVADVIRAVSKLDASYPDVAQMLVQADRQKSIDRLELDALPQAGRIYHRPPAEVASAAGSDFDKESKPRESKTRVGKPNLSPNLFTPVERKPAGSSDAADKALDIETTDEPPPGDSGEAKVADAGEPREKPAERRKGLFGVFRRD
jgi:hypothetical protein